MKVFTHALALVLGLAIAWSWPVYQKHDAKEVKRGYVVPFTADGKAYTFSFRKRPSLYASWCTPIWIVEGWEPAEAERLMEAADDELLGVDGSMSGKVRLDFKLDWNE